MSISKKVVTLLISAVLVVMSGICLAKTSLVPEFSLRKIKVKVGTTQFLSSILSWPNVDVENLRSSDTSVIQILENGNLKAVGTGISTVTYTYDVNGKQEETYCFVEVTRDESTFAEVTGVASMKIKLSLVIDGTTTIIESSKGAIPTYPEFIKSELVFDGWYKKPDFTEKVGERERFGSDTTLYARWLTKEEAEFMNKKVFESSYYDDINEHWGKIAIEAVTRLSWFNGVSERTFGPEVPMTRAMAVAVIGRIDGAAVEGLKSNIEDSKVDGYYDGYLAWAIQNKIVTDVVDGKFRPNDEITREEMAVYMSNYILYKQFDIKLPLDTSYSDINDLPNETKQAIKILYNLGIMQGTSESTFSPKSHTTRAQMAQIFYNYYNFSMKNN